MLRHLVLIFVSIILLFSSCHSLVEDEFSYFAKVPVMNGLLQADSTFKVQVSLTANLTDTAPTYVNNARVIIESNVDTPDTLVYTQNGWYTSVRTVKVGASYTCKTIIPGYSTITAQTTIPELTEIDSIESNDFVERDEEGANISSIKFRIKNKVGTKCFWNVKLFVKGFGVDYNSETGEQFERLIMKEKSFFMKVEQDAVMLNEAMPLEVFSNKKIKDDHYWVRTYFKLLSGSAIPKNGTFVIELQNVDETYYRYIKQYYIYEFAQYPSIGQSNQKYQMYSNVKNGLGVFTGMSVSRKIYLSLTLKGE